MMIGASPGGSPRRGGLFVGVVHEMTCSRSSKVPALQISPTFVRCCFGPPCFGIVSAVRSIMCRIVAPARHININNPVAPSVRG
jgi:hypothetical protein